MAKKNKSTRKHRFKHTESAAETSMPATAVSEQPTANSRPAVSATVAQADFGYVTTDLRRVGVFAISLILLELLLWYLMSHTGLGNSIYNLIQV